MLSLTRIHLPNGTTSMKSHELLALLENRLEGYDREVENIKALKRAALASRRTIVIMFFAYMALLPILAIAFYLRNEMFGYSFCSVMMLLSAVIGITSVMSNNKRIALYDSIQAALRGLIENHKEYIAQTKAAISLINGVPKPQAGMEEVN